MRRLLLYVVILAVGAALAYVVANAIGAMGVIELAGGGEESAISTLTEGGRQLICKEGPTVFGLPIKDLAVGVITTMFGMIMRGMFRSRG